MSEGLQDRQLVTRPQAVLLLLASLLISVASARADVVMPPPAECPEGSRPMGDHLGSRCEPTTCETAANCAVYGARAWECADTGLCIQIFDARDRTGQYRLERAVGACASDGDCSDGSACEVRARCLPVEGPARFVQVVPWVPATSEVERATAGGCAAASTSVLLVLALLAAGAAFTLRRARVHHTREEAVRALLLARGRATRVELLALGRSDERVARALAPLATRVEVEADDDGQVVYRIERADAVGRRRS